MPRRSITLPPVTLGGRIRGKRLAMGLSQTQLGGAEFSASYISAIERGKIRPSLKALRILAQRLGEPVTYFLQDEEGVRQGIAVDASLVEAHALLLLGKTEAAHRILDEVQGQVETAPPDKQVYWYLLKGQVLSAERQLDQAIASLEQALSLAQAHTLPLLKEKARLALGQAYAQQGKLVLAVEYHRQCLQSLTNGAISDVGLAAKVYASLAHELLTLQRSSEALAFYNDAVKIVDTIQDLRSLADHYLTRAAEAHTQGDATTSYNLARDGLALLIALDSMHDAHQIYASFGQLLASTGDAAQVESYLIQGLEIARRVNIPQDIVTSATSLADLYLKRGDIVQAEHYILEALREAQDHGGPREEAQATLSLAAIADAQGRQSDAAAHYEKAIQLLEALGPSDLLSMAYFRYGQALVAWGDTVRGSQYLEKAYLHKG